MESVVTFRLPTADHDRLNRLALRLSWERQERVGTSQLLRECLEEVFNKYDTEKKG
jgi:hypothetical protein